MDDMLNKLSEKVDSVISEITILKEENSSLKREKDEIQKEIEDKNREQLSAISNKIGELVEKLDTAV